MREPEARTSAVHPTLREKVAFLRAPENYPDHPKRVDAIETHFAWVFLTAQHAYKLKKPMRHGLMDYRSLAARERGCREEVRLNRRLAPSVYRNVIPLSTRGENLVLGKGERVEEWLVKMRRLPSSRMLDHVLERDTLRASELNSLSAMALEIERLGHRPLAEELVRRFRVGSGDLACDVVFHFYVSHRAATRAKLAAWHVEDPQYPDPRPWVARTHSYLRDALRHVNLALRSQATHSGAATGATCPVDTTPHGSMRKGPAQSAAGR